MGTFGHKVFEPLMEDKNQNESSSIGHGEELFLRLKRKSRKSGQVIEASCKQTSEGFVVLKGSRIETIDSESVPPAIKANRQKASIDDDGILQEDVLCSTLPMLLPSLLVDTSMDLLHGCPPMAERLKRLKAVPLAKSTIRG